MVYKVYEKKLLDSRIHSLILDDRILEDAEILFRTRERLLELF